jgi:hypothetical protein
LAFGDKDVNYCSGFHTLGELREFNVHLRFARYFVYKKNGKDFSGSIPSF